MKAHPIIEAARQELARYVTLTRSSSRPYRDIWQAVAALHERGCLTLVEAKEGGALLVLSLWDEDDEPNDIEAEIIDALVVRGNPELATPILVSADSLG